MKTIHKYIGTYYISVPVDDKGKNTKNPNDTFLKGIAGTETYRENDSTLSIYMPKGKSTSNSIIPKLALLGVTLTSKHIQEEEVWTFPEDQIHIVHKVLKFGIVGKNNQAIHPINGLVITKEKLKKILDKIENKDK